MKGLTAASGLLSASLLAAVAVGALASNTGVLRDPRIGEDHWHASYTFYACGEKQPNVPTWEGGIPPTATA